MSGWTLYKDEFKDHGNMDFYREVWTRRPKAEAMADIERHGHLDTGKCYADAIMDYYGGDPAAAHKAFEKLAFGKFEKSGIDFGEEPFQETVYWLPDCSGASFSSWTAQKYCGYVNFQSFDTVVWLDGQTIKTHDHSAFWIQD